MEHYEPPFTITNSILQLVAAISEKVGRIDVVAGLDKKPQLRRNNRIKSVHASLKIEANSLPEGVVRDVLNNHAVIGPMKEIQEVKNAFAAYDLIGRVDPYSLSDLKHMHRIMTHLTVSESGEFRKGAEGVFDGERCIFIAPPPEMVQPLMEDLFNWMIQQKETVHPLIMSCVFHYEFVFIHPFSDGNGRIARLWQTVLLTNWHSIFQYIPLESQIEKFQNGYYDAISKCNLAGNSTAFIEFMLSRIDDVLAEFLLQNQEDTSLSEQVQRLLACMDFDVPYTAENLLRLLGLKSKEALRRNYLEPAMRTGYVKMTIPEKPTSRNQKYVKC